MSRQLGKQIDVWRRTWHPLRILPLSSRVNLQWSGSSFADHKSVFHLRPLSTTIDARGASVDDGEGQHSPETELEAKNSERPATASHDEISHFFTRRPPDFSDKHKVDASKAKVLLLLCDKAIAHARDSAAHEHLQMVRETLAGAADLYLTIAEEAGVLHTSEVYYETYLVRSSYLSVIRTVAAVNGAQNLADYASMMSDFLDFENRLAQMGVRSMRSALPPFDKPVVPNEIMRIQAKDVKDLERAFFQTPLLQDAAPTLYDIFDDFRAICEMPASEVDARNQAAINDLVKAIDQLPLHVWQCPITPSWDKFRVWRRPKYADAAQLILTCRQKYIDALLFKGLISEAYHQYKHTTQHCMDSRQPPRKLAWSFAYRFAAIRRKLQHLVQSPEKEDHFHLMDSYMSALASAIGDIAEGGIPQGRSDRYTKRHMPESWALILLCALRIERLTFTGMSKDFQRKVDAIKGSVGAFVERLVEGAITIPHGSPDVNMDVLNTHLVEALLSGASTVSGAGDGETDIRVVQLVKFLSTQPHMQHYRDQMCCTVLSNATGRYWPLIAYGAIQTLEVHARLDLQARGLAALKWAPALESPILPIFESAQLASKTSTIVGILRVCAKMFSRFPRNGRLPKDPVLLRGLDSLYKALDITPERLIFTLYPSLDIRRPTRMYRRRMKDYKAKAKRTAFELDARTTPYSPDVLLAALRFTVRLGRNGLMERIWLTMRRKQRRAEAAQEGKTTAKTVERKPLEPYVVPAVAYAAIFHGYAEEVRHSLRLHRRSRSTLSRQARFSRRMNIGFGYRLGFLTPHDRFAPPRPKTTSIEAAQRSAVACYGQLRETWAKYTSAGSEESSEALPVALRPSYFLYRSLLRVFATRENARKQVVDLSVAYATGKNAAFLEEVRQDMAYFDITAENCRVAFPSFESSPSTEPSNDPRPFIGQVDHTTAQKPVKVASQATQASM